MASSKKGKNNGPHNLWRNDRAYADFRSYSDVGGERKALAAPGKRRGTTDPNIAEALFAKELARFRACRDVLWEPSGRVFRKPGEFGACLRRE